MVLSSSNYPFLSIILTIAFLAAFCDLILIFLQINGIYDGTLQLLDYKSAQRTNVSVPYVFTEPLSQFRIEQLNLINEYIKVNITNNLPLTHIPHQTQLNFSQLIEMELPNKNKCKFRGKVFNLGLSKTGTSTMAHILRKELGFSCTRKPMVTCAYCPLWRYFKDSFLPLYVSPNDISWLFHSEPLHSDFLRTLQRANAFGDAPWNSLYPMYDQLIAPNHTKFILTVRDSTRDAVNSNMKMFARDYIRRILKNEEGKVQFDYTNFSKHAKPRIVEWEQFWMLSARQYELHNQNVINYFSQRQRLDDLLIINLAKESKKPINEQWFRITDFLGCDNVTKALPTKNRAKDRSANQIDFFPKDYMIRWWEYEKYPKSVINILEVVESMNGIYNQTKWNKLKHLYGQIYAKKKR